MQAERHEITESKSKDIQIILSYFNVLSSLDFLVFWLMISITASDTKTRPPIFQQVLGKSLEQGMAMAAPQCGGGENNVSTINHLFSCIAPGSRDNLRHSLILPGHAWKTLALAPKLYIASTLNIDLILWHTQLIVCAVKCFMV